MSVQHTCAPCNAADVVLDFYLCRKRPCPIRIQCKRIRIEMRRHIACRAGIGVLTPRTTYVVAALQHDEVPLPGFVQSHSRTESGETAADNRDMHVLWD